MRRLCVSLLFVASASWALTIVAAPHAVELAERFPAQRHTLAAVTTMVYLAGERICHQRPERSFMAAGFQYPVCARCTGLYVAAPFGILAMLLGRRRSRARGTAGDAYRRWRTILAVAAVPTLLSIALERGLGIGAGASGNMSRALAALPLGAAAAAFVAAAILGFGPDLRQIAHGGVRNAGPRPRV